MGARVFIEREGIFMGEGTLQKPRVVKAGEFGGRVIIDGVLMAPCPLT